MNSKVSIIIACYNDPDVVKAVDSAKNQTYPNKEIILVDDGSNEKTKKIIAKIELNVDSLVTQKNRGQSIARNNGIKKAQGKYILNLDSDDYFEPEFCEKAIRMFEADEEIKIVTCKARRFNKKRTIDIFTPRGGEIDSFIFHNSALGSSMFRKRDWESVGGYEEKLPILGFEDWEFYIQLLKTGGSAFVIPEVLFNYQVRKNSITSRIKHLKQMKFQHIIQKHQGLYQENFPELINHLFDRIIKAEEEINRRETSIDFKTGNRLLFPFRKLKSIFN